MGARPVAAATRGFKWFYSPRAVGTPLLEVYTCAPPSALVVRYSFTCYFSTINYDDDDELD